jgi:hypothetical protein
MVKRLLQKVEDGSLRVIYIPERWALVNRCNYMQDQYFNEISHVAIK